MKTPHYLILIALTIFLRTAFAQNVKSLSLEAHEVGTADGTYTKWYANDGSFDRDFHRRKQILVAVRDFSRKIAAVQVHVYFIGHPMGAEKPLFIYNRAEFCVQMGGRLEASGVVEAPSLKANVQNYAALGVAYVSGADIDGWIVTADYKGQIFGIRASRQALLEIAEGNARQQEFLPDMVAEYEARISHRQRTD